MKCQKNLTKGNWKRNQAKKKTIAILNNEDSTLAERLIAKVLKGLDITIRELAA